MGPLMLRNGGMELPGAMDAASTTCGLLAGGLDPPTAGKAWHPAQESRLNRGPSPSATVSAVLNLSKPMLLKKLISPGVNPAANGCPAPAGPSRNPGSEGGLPSCTPPDA